jgi:hypothetical protein
MNQVWEIGEVTLTKNLGLFWAILMHVSAAGGRALTTNARKSVEFIDVS